MTATMIQQQWYNINLLARAGKKLKCSDLESHVYLTCTRVFHFLGAQVAEWLARPSLTNVARVRSQLGI